MIKRENLLLILAGFFLLSGIGRHDVSEESYRKLAKQKQFDCVGKVYIDNKEAGSCVLICDGTVLSAAHVFVQSETKPDTVNFNGQKAVVFVPFNQHIVKENQISIEFNGEKYKVKRLAVHKIMPIQLRKAFATWLYWNWSKPLKG